MITGRGPPMNLDRDTAALCRLIDEAERIAVFTGAGISTESGIPDFRSPGGIWTRLAPIDFDAFLASEEARREAWRRKFASDGMIRSAKPNRGHRAVAELVRRGIEPPVFVSQNVDDFRVHNDALRARSRGRIRRVA